MSRAVPDEPPAIKSVPGPLGSFTDFRARHEFIWNIEAHSALCSRQPIPIHRNTFDHPTLDSFFPLLKIQRARERCEDHELCRHQLCALGDVGSRRKRFRTIARQSEDERAD